MVFQDRMIYLTRTDPLGPLLIWRPRTDGWMMSPIASPTDEDWRALAHEHSIALHEDADTMREHCRALLAAGMPADTPTALMSPGRSARPSMCDLATLLEVIPSADTDTTSRTLILVGAISHQQTTLAWYDQRPLLGARIALTRTLDAVPRTAGRVLELGGEPLILPLTRTIAIGPGHPRWPDIARVSSTLEGYQWLLFTSAQGVTFFLDLIRASGRDTEALTGARIACVGQATANTLRAHGLQADVIPERGSGRALAEAVIAHAGPHIRGARILFPRALEGREEAVLGLREAGAHVDLMPVYRTVLASVADRSDDVSDIVLASGLRMLERKQVDAIAFFAPSQVDGLFDLLGAAAREIVGSCLLVAAIGDTTKAALTRRGVDVHVVAPSPSAEMLIRALADAWRAREP